MRSLLSHSKSWVAALLPMLALGLAASSASGAPLRAGEVLAATGDDGLLRVDPATGARSTLAPADGFASPSDVEVAPGGEIFVVDEGAGAIVRVDPATGATTSLPASELSASPVDLSVGPEGALFVADTGGETSAGSVLRVDPGSGAASLVAEGHPLGDLEEPRGILARADGSLLVTSATILTGEPGDTGVSRLLEIDAETGSASTIAGVGGALAPGTLARGAGGNLFVEELVGLVRVNRTSGETSGIELEDLLGGSSPAADAQGRILFTASASASSGGGVETGLFRLDPATEAFERLVPGHTFPGTTGLAVVPVPEPASSALVGLGLAGFALRRRAPAR